MKTNKKNLKKMIALSVASALASIAVATGM
jgi:hypothetical protein